MANVSKIFVCKIKRKNGMIYVLRISLIVLQIWVRPRFRVQCAKTRLLYITTDFVRPRYKLLFLSETWIENNHPISWNPEFWHGFAFQTIYNSFTRTNGRCAVCKNMSFSDELQSIENEKRWTWSELRHLTTTSVTFARFRRQSMVIEPYLYHELVKALMNCVLTCVSLNLSKCVVWKN